MNFSELHSFFEELYDSSAESIDEIAERIRMLGFQVSANHENFLKKSFIESEINTGVKSSNMIETLLNDKHTTIQNMRKAI